MNAPKLNLVVLALLVSALTHAQSYYRVNNNAGVTGASLYTTLGAALADGAIAYAGDPLTDVVFIVEGSNDDYDGAGTIDVTFPCIIYGTGYFLNENPQTQADPRPSTIPSIRFTTGANGSEMYGISSSTILVEGDDVTISKCNVADRMTVSGDDATISKNFIEASNATTVLHLDGAANATVINNFIFNTNTSGTYNMSMTAGASGVVLYNSFWGEDLNVFSNAVIEGNFFLASEFDSMTSTNITVNANADTSSFLNINFNGPNHAFDTWPDSIFCIAAVPPESTDGQYQTNLTPWPGDDSPIYDPTTMLTLFGMYGGANPYLKSGMPRIPSIYEYSGSGSGTSGGGSGSTVKTKTHK